MNRRKIAVNDDPGLTDEQKDDQMLKIESDFMDEWFRVDGKYNYRGAFEHMLKLTHAAHESETDAVKKQALLERNINFQEALSK